MLEIFGFSLGTPLQGASFAALLGILGLIIRVWIVGIPERTRATAERQTIDNAERTRQFTAWREEVHLYKNQVMKLTGRVTELERLLTHALATSSTRKEQMDNMMHLIELLIDEVDRIDKTSIIVPQARLLLKQMRAAANRKVDPFINNPHQSDALNATEHTVEAAEEAKAAAETAHKEVKAEEAKK